MSTRESSAVGAYGLRIEGAEAARHLLVPVPADWPALGLVSFLDPDVQLEPEDVTDERACLNLRTGGRLTLDRSSGIASYRVPRALGPDELVHPFLAPAAAVMSHWLRRPCFHAGAFVAGGRAWGVLGGREAGKSSLLARLALDGHPVVTDDVLVLGPETAYAGPRSIDLREEAAGHLEAGASLGVAGARPRWRVALPPIGHEVPFAGWVFLSWEERLDAVRLPASECLTRLLAHTTMRVPSSAPASFLDLAGLPAWELRRPRDWDALRRSSERLLDAVAG